MACQFTHLPNCVSMLRISYFLEGLYCLPPPGVLGFPFDNLYTAFKRACMKSYGLANAIYGGFYPRKALMVSALFGSGDE